MKSIKQTFQTRFFQFESSRIIQIFKQTIFFIFKKIFVIKIALKKIERDISILISVEMMRKMFFYILF